MHRRSLVVIGLVLVSSIFVNSNGAEAITTVPPPPASQVLGLNDEIIDISGDGRFVYAHVATDFVRVDLRSGESTPVVHGTYRSRLTNDGSAMVIDTTVDIVAEDTNHGDSIYRYSFATQTYALIALSFGDWFFNLQDISGDGRYLALAGVNGNFADSGAFVYDTATSTFRQPDSLLPDFALGVVRQSETIRLSADGRYAVWRTYPTVGCATCEEVWVYDWATNSAVNASTRTNGGDLTDGNAGGGGISSDGRHIVFRSNASNLVSGITTTGWRVYARNLDTSTTVLVSSKETTQRYSEPRIGPGGGVITLLEDLDSTYLGGHFPTPQPVLYDLMAGTRAVLTDPPGTTVPNGDTRSLLTSRGGTRVLFSSAATNFAPVSPAVPPDDYPYRTFSVARPELLPARLLDTRVGARTDDGLFQGIGRLAANDTLQLTVGSRRGIPLNSKAAVINITAIQPVGGPYGFVTAYPCGITLPNASSLNLLPGRAVANMSFAELGAGGKICLFTNVAVDLIVDVFSVFPPDSELATIDPQRMLDTRSGGSTIDGQFRESGPVAPTTEFQLQLGGRGDIPPTATAVLLNVTSTGAPGEGYITAYPCGGSVPNASMSNYQVNITKASMTVVALSATGKVCLLTSQPVHLLADAVGYFADLPGNPSEYVALNPARLVDTRVGGATIDRQYQGIGLRTAGSTFAFTVVGRGGVPGTASTVVLDVVAAASAGNGFVTVYPCGQPTPLVSSVNMLQGGTVNNHVVVETGADGQVCMFASHVTHLIVDVEGVLP